MQSSKVEMEIKFSKFQSSNSARSVKTSVALGKVTFIGRSRGRGELGRDFGAGNYKLTGEQSLIYLVHF